MALTEKVKINWKFQEDNLAWNDLQSRSFFVQSYPEFPHLRGILGASQKNDLKSALMYIYYLAILQVDKIDTYTF